jgi:hypothetical protein
MNHFKYDIFNNYYIKNYHNIGKCMAKNTSWEQFVIKMDNYYKNNINYNNFVGKNEDLRIAYDFYSCYH